MQTPDVYQNINDKDVAPTPPSTINQGSNGIIITSPKTNEIVKLPITVQGYVSGEGWLVFEGEAGTVYATDGNGKVISSTQPLRITSDPYKLPAYFEVVVGDRQMMSNMSTDNGYLIFRSSAAKDGELIKEYKLPVNFQ